RLCVQINKNMFGRVLSNIIMNAVQNPPEKGKIKIWTENHGDTARLAVINTGAHIPEDVLPRLFDPFYRVDKSRSRSQGSSGLGLTIVKKALDQMNIPFAIENTDTGVLFWMDLQL
ncbi:vancomycin resistance histidine kinase VanS, partial [Clostridium perfringens]|uniref:ATP-binding protein n=1 Tax=Clostridium perfringens TaxID=1502 RepID=UPI002AC64D7F